MAAKTDKATGGTGTGEGSSAPPPAAGGAGAGTGEGSGAPPPAAGQGITEEEYATRLTAEKAKWEQDQKDKAEKDRQKREQDDAIAQGQFKPALETANTRIAQLEADLANERRLRWIDKAAAKYTLRPELAARLQGNTEEEIDADAKALAGLQPPPAAPKTEAGAGNKPPPQTESGAGAGARAGAGNAGSTQRYRFQQPGDVAWG